MAGCDFDLDDAVGEDVGVVVHDVEARDEGTGYGTGENVVPAVSGVGVVRKTSAFIVDPCSVPGGVGAEVDPSLVASEVFECG
jgi:hypothetical protein